METKKRSFWERYAYRQLSKNVRTQATDNLFLLSEEEKKSLKSIRNQTYLKAGLAGALGVILLYVPYHLFEETLFPKRDIWIPIYNDSLKLEIEFLIYSVVLVFIEIWYLTYINIKAVDAISKACGCLDPEDPKFDEDVDSLIQVGLEKKHEELKKVGINPYEGLSKWGVLAFQVLIKLKAAISGFIWKLFVSKILGRYALRIVVDVLGAPIYAAWNIYGSRKVMNEARVRVMAPPLINHFSLQLEKEFGENEEFRSVLYSTLQAISVSKRSFHYNHYLLATSLLTRFDIEVKSDPSYDKDFLKKVDELTLPVQKAVSKLIVFGILIDGGLSQIEKRSLIRLKKEGVLPYSIETVKKWSNDYFEGKGLEAFFKS
ncbi:MAG: hypothetical protein CSA03_02365 [Bacteroidetes bacterium]|nr:MAG: hypothetical protein CSA03_02365 [Bacteroidota bacterium]